MAFVVWIFSPASPASPATRLTYVVVKEEVYDAPIKTQIVQHIVVSGVPREAELRAEIFKLYRSAKARRGFRYHNPATNIYLYVYGTKEQARAQGIRWIGMIAMGPLDKVEPRVAVDEGRLAALSQKPEDRFSLSEQKRKRAFREVGAAEDRAWDEAKARVPDQKFTEIAMALQKKRGGVVPPGRGAQVMKLYRKQLMKQTDLAHKLQKQYRAEIARKHGLTDEQLLKISFEGVTKGWVD